MSIFGKIMGAIFGSHAEAATPASRPEAGGGNAISTSNAAAAGSNVDVAAILDRLSPRKKKSWRGGPRSLIS